MNEKRDDNLPGRHPAMAAGGAFQTTQWSRVISAAEGDSPDSARALSELCEKYWPPLYLFLLRKLGSPEEAQEWTQAFFHRLLEKGTLAAADPERGRFRTFLLASLRNFVSNERERRDAVKRGGGVQHFSLDPGWADRFTQLADRQANPEEQFERQWAVAVLDCALQRLRDEYAEAGNGKLYQALYPLIARSDATTSYAELAAKLGQSAASLRVAAHRLRGRYRQLVREEISQTLQETSEVDDEIRKLFLTFSN